ncbi:hypothetical protein [Pseudomonas sp. NFPP17]|uniref:hypothetical protein n=1 Tax=unclassified Pseudomonas TaxID=196821 RepID=UPI0031F322C6
MTLHIPTLLVVSTFIFVLTGLSTIHTWLRETRERPLSDLSSMMLLAALGLAQVSLHNLEAEFVPEVLGNMVLLLLAALNRSEIRILTAALPANRKYWLEQRHGLLCA